MPIVSIDQSTAKLTDIEIDYIQSSQEILDNTIFQIIKSQATFQNQIIKNLNIRAFFAFKSQISFNNSTIENCFNQKLSGIGIYLDQSNALVNNSFFKNISSSQAPAIYASDISQSSSSKSLTVVNTLFQNNYAIYENAGAIMIIDMNLFMNLSQFESNKAQQKAGAIYLSCSQRNSKFCYFQLMQNQFLKNLAFDNGGAIYYDLFQPLYLSTNQFQNNSATYGNDIASYPIKLKYLLNDQLDIDALVSGKTVQEDIKVGIYDLDDQLIVTDNESEASLLSDDILLSVSGQTKIKQSKKLYRLLTRISPIYLLTLKCKQDFENVYKGKYSRIKNVFNVLKELIRQILKALNACGVLIMVYAMEDLRQRYILGIGELQISRLSYMSVAILRPAWVECNQNALKVIKEGYAVLVQDQQMDSLLNSPKRNKPQTVLLRILTNYFQVIMLAKDFELQWPDKVEQILSIFSFVSSSQQNLISFDCFYQQLGSQPIHSYYLRIIIYGLTPILMSLAGVFLWIMIRLTVKRKDKEFSIKRNIKTTCYSIILLLHPTITTNTFQLFSCMSFEDGKSYLRKDMSIQCWTSSHLKWSAGIAIPILLVWIVGFPLFIYAQLHRIKGQYGEIQNLQLYGLFYVGLTDKAIYWELIVVNFRKFTIIVIGTFVTQDKQSLKALLTILILFIQNYYTRNVDPYIDPRNSQIDFHSSMASVSYSILYEFIQILVLFGGMFFIDADVQKNDSVLTALFFMILLYNVFFLSQWLLTFLLCLLRIHANKLQRFKRFLPFLKHLKDYESNLGKILIERQQSIRKSLKNTELIKDSNKNSRFSEVKKGTQQIITLHKLSQIPQTDISMLHNQTNKNPGSSKDQTKFLELSKISDKRDLNYSRKKVRSGNIYEDKFSQNKLNEGKRPNQKHKSQHEKVFEKKESLDKVFVKSNKRQTEKNQSNDKNKERLARKLKKLFKTQSKQVYQENENKKSQSQNHLALCNSIINIELTSKNIESHDQSISIDSSVLIQSQLNNNKLQVKDNSIDQQQTPKKFYLQLNELRKNQKKELPPVQTLRTNRGDQIFSQYAEKLKRNHLMYLNKSQNQINSDDQ
eukprot:403333113